MNQNHEVRNRNKIKNNFRNANMYFLQKQFLCPLRIIGKWPMLHCWCAAAADYVQCSSIEGCVGRFHFCMPTTPLFLYVLRTYEHMPWMYWYVKYTISWHEFGRYYIDMYICFGPVALVHSYEKDSVREREREKWIWNEFGCWRVSACKV